MIKVVITGCGAAYGVPSVPRGWGVCNPQNPKNRRLRAGVYFEENDTRILIDTSPDLHAQLETLHINRLDGVLYTHTHADHLHGIDDLRGITSYMRHNLNFYAVAEHLEEIVRRFSYAIPNIMSSKSKTPLLEPHTIQFLQEFSINQTTVMPLAFAGHSMVTTGFSFNNGKVVLVPDFMTIPPETLSYFQGLNVNLLIMPLTAMHGGAYHASLETLLRYVEVIKPERVVLTHMGIECDYDDLVRITPDFMMPAYDGLTIEL